jgi:hypothetical protein
LRFSEGPSDVASSGSGFAVLSGSASGFDFLGFGFAAFSDPASGFDCLGFGFVVTFGSGCAAPSSG